MISRIAHRLIRSFPPWYCLRARAALGILEGSVDAEVRHVAKYVPRDRRHVALDVGANNGVTAWVLSRVFTKVHAFEPNAELLAQWKCVAPANVVAWECALSDAAAEGTLLVPVIDEQVLTGWASLDQPGVGAPESFVRMPVARRTLDSINLGDDPVDFVKIDVEGHEMAVLRGAEQLFRRWSPWVVVEVWDKHRPAVLQWFSELGYEVVDLASEFRLSQAPQNLILRPKQNGGRQPGETRSSAATSIQP